MIDMMRYVFFMGLLTLIACSDSNNNDSTNFTDTETAPLLPFQTYDGPVQPRGGECEDSIDVDAPLITSSLGYDSENTRNALSIIDSENVSQLRLNFTYANEGVTEIRGASAVTAQAIFFIAGDELLAINRDSGCRYWRHANTQGNAAFRSAAVVLVWENEGTPVVFVGDYQGNVHAINALDGSLLWQTFAGTNAAMHFITGGMQYHDGMLIVPISSKEVVAGAFLPGPCCTSHGMLVALDASSGERMWEYHTTAEADQIIEPGQRVGPSGAPVWSAPTIDRERNSVYFGTGQNYTEPTTNTSDAIIALDLATGAVKWIFQATANDAWNYACQYMIVLRCPVPEGDDLDFGAAPILLADGGAIIAGDKGGVVYSINADSGALNWSRKISTGSKLGGIHWGMAVDDEKVYVAATDFEIDAASGALNDLMPEAKPGIYALNQATGELVWEIHPTQVYEGLDTPVLFSAAVTVTNDVLFAGALNGTVAAFSVNDGQELWRYDVNQALQDINGIAGDGGSIDGAGLVIAGDGLVVNSGYTEIFGGVGRYQAGEGNTVFVFSLQE